MFDDLTGERRAREAEGAVTARHAPEVVKIAEAVLADGSDTVKSLVITPQNVTSDIPIVFVHGGGWVFGSPRQSVGLAQTIATIAQRPLVSIGYRLAPEHPFPCGLEDVIEGLSRVQSGQVPDIPAGPADVVGFSAGANLVAGANLRNRHTGHLQPRRLVLFYGVFDMDRDAWSHDAFGHESEGLSQARMRAFTKRYLPDDSSPPEAHTITADLGGFPPTHLICGARDMLLSDTLALHQNAINRGVDVSLEILPGLSHGFANSWFKDTEITRLIHRLYEPAQNHVRNSP